MKGKSITPKFKEGDLVLHKPHSTSKFFKIFRVNSVYTRTIDGIVSHIEYLIQSTNCGLTGMCTEKDIMPYNGINKALLRLKKE